MREIERHTWDDTDGRRLVQLHADGDVEQMWKMLRKKDPDLTQDRRSTGSIQQRRGLDKDRFGKVYGAAAGASAGAAAGAQARADAHSAVSARSSVFIVTE